MANLNNILPIVLIALILVSAVQAFQLNGLKEKLESGKVSVSSGAKSPVASPGAGSAAASSGASGSGSSISDLPTMVGGC